MLEGLSLTAGQNSRGLWVYAASFKTSFSRKSSLTPKPGADVPLRLPHTSLGVQLLVFSA